MIDLNSIQTGGDIRPPITVIHGAPGSGKTTFAASAPSPIFIRTEDGLGQLSVDTFPEMADYDDLIQALTTLYKQDHNYHTIVIDSLSALEPIIHKKVVSDQNKDNIKSIEDIGFGKGYMYALDYWRQIIAAVKALARDKNMMPVMIAHTDIVKYDSPEVDAYDRYQIKLHKRAFQMLYEQADIIGFAHYPVHVKKSDDKSGKAVAKGGRQLRLEESPAVIAKNRYSMPEIINLDFSEFLNHLPTFKQ